MDDRGHATPIDAFRTLWEDESAPTAAEYAILASLIAVVIITSVGTFGTAVRGLFERLTSQWP
jgi:Flp pilus assembly pilin Flp